MVATSGTVSGFPYTNEKIIQHAARRAGFKPQQLSAEDLQVALDSLFSVTAEWSAVGFQLWTRQFLLLGCTIGSPDVATPAGTLEILHSYWRIFLPYRGECTLSDGGFDGNLFSGQPGPDVVVQGPNPFVTVPFSGATETDTIGVLLGGSTTFTGTATVYSSPDGVSFTQAQQYTGTFVPGAWTYFDLNPTIVTPYLRIVFMQSGPIAIQQLQFALANPQDIENGPLSIDDYYNLPNKQFRSDRPVSTYQDRQLAGPVLKIWPVLNEGGFYNGTISVLARRYIQDPGTLTQVMELPQYWYEAIVNRLSTRLYLELPGELASQARQPLEVLEQLASKSESIAWAENRVQGPIRIYPVMSCYTK